MDKRQQQIEQWLGTTSDYSQGTLQLLTGDASFRRYFRLKAQNKNYVVMDAPPEHENCVPFIAVARGFAKAGIPVPEIKAIHLEAGFILLSDFGDDLLLGALSPESASTWYQHALDILVDIQTCVAFESGPLPTFDSEFMAMELERYRYWYLDRLCQMHLTTKQQKILFHTLSHLYQVIAEQPLVCIHRDYHSRNLMVTGEQSLGVLDFQDAMWGPLTYDVVSLLRDCYIDWPLDKVHPWALYYKQALQQRGRLKGVSDSEYLRWFDYTGVQRHLKCLGIFARLALRDGKKGYLNDIPRVRNYIEETCDRYPELSGLADILQQSAF